MFFLLISSWQPINKPDLMILSALGNFPYEDHLNFLATGCLSNIACKYSPSLYS